MNMSKSQAPRANAGGRVNFKVEQPASHKRAADRLTAGTPPTRSLSGATWAPSGRLRVRKVGRRTIVTPTMPTSG
jgi:hypothetical protein